MTPFLDGKKIYLREPLRPDVPVWFQWFNDSEVTHLMSKGVFPNTEQAQEEYFKNLSKNKTDFQLAIIDKQDDRLAGMIGIHKIDWIHRNGDVSILIGDKTKWGKGLAAEAVALITEHAFQKMNLHHLTAGMMALNESSRKCFEKNGFVVEGVKREHFFYQDQYVDVPILGLLAKEWKELHSQTKRPEPAVKK